eukprot:g20411.t1
MVQIWNELPEEATTLKRHWGRYIDRKGLKGYGPNAGKCDLFSSGNLGGMDELGQGVCFRAAQLYVQLLEEETTEIRHVAEIEASYRDR